MGSMKNWMLAAAVVLGAASLGATNAQAQEFRFHVRGPVETIPPCPGPGYVWVNGYMADGYWVDGYWTFPNREYAPIARYGFGYGRDWDHDRFRGGDRDWDHRGDRNWGGGRDGDRDRHFDRDRNWHQDGDRDHDHFRR